MKSREDIVVIWLMYTAAGKASGQCLTKIMGAQTKKIPFFCEKSEQKRTLKAEAVADSRAVSVSTTFYPVQKSREGARRVPAGTPSPS